ncbi:centrin-like EF hand protein [Cryptosporidium canis]|uniref:Centrin-like EF hand protein n=1 Tax=Cryptosporidium canis TaxID=195482 RepID=A0A9D5DI71_9CRYT|nr:centrin-like EF hand protein [Cryptosporidium canis]
MEIHFSSLSDYLVGKKLVPGDWGVLLKSIERDLCGLVERSICNDDISEEARAHLMSVKNDEKNYSFLNRLIEFLISSKEGEKKTIFGSYKSELINELMNIKKRYQGNNLHLSEAVREINYILRFGFSHLEKEQRETVSKIKSTTKRIQELADSKSGNVELYKNKLSSFGLGDIVGGEGASLKYFPRDRVTDGIQYYYNLRLDEFSSGLFEEINNLIQDNNLVNLYLKLIKQANADLADSDDYILEYMIDFPVLSMLCENQEKSDCESDLSSDEKENEYYMEIIENSDTPSSSDQDYKGFEVVKEDEPHIKVRIFEDRQLFGKLLMELYEIESFLKRYLIENLGSDWKTKLGVEVCSEDQIVINYYNLVSKIVAKLTAPENYEIVTFRRNKYIVVERHTEAILNIFNSILGQQNSIEKMESRVKEYYQELGNCQKKHAEYSQRVKDSTAFLQNELKSLFNKEYVIKGVQK